MSRRRYNDRKRRAHRLDMARGVVLATLGLSIIATMGAVRYTVARQPAETFRLVVHAPVGTALHAFVADYDLTADDCHRARATYERSGRYEAVRCEVSR